MWFKSIYYDLDKLLKTQGYTVQVYGRDHVYMFLETSNDNLRYH